MTDMMRNIRFWLKASSTISKRRNPSYFRSFKASLMRKRSAQKWKLERNSLNDSLTNARPKLNVALEHGNQGKGIRPRDEREHLGDSDRTTKSGIRGLLAIRRESETVRVRHE